MQLLRKGLTVERFLYYRVFLDSCKNVADTMRLTEFVSQITKEILNNIGQRKHGRSLNPHCSLLKNECL